MVICNRIEPSAWAQAFPLIRQLRTALDEAEFLQRVRRQSHGGYELVGAYRDGSALMAYAEADARARGMGAVFLDARPDAIPFYEREQYTLHAAPSMKKVISQ